MTAPLFARAITYGDAADASGYSIKVIREAIDNGDLLASWGTATKPVILVAELDRWLESLPNEKPKRSPARLHQAG